MNCRDARQLISPYLDQQLTGREMLEMQEHFSRCDSCLDEMQSIRQVKHLLRGLHTPSPQRDLSDSIHLRLREAESGGWRVLVLPTPRFMPATRPPRGRRLATALALSFLTVLAIAPASREGARSTSRFLSTAFFMPMDSSSLAALSGPGMSDPMMLSQPSVRVPQAQEMQTPEVILISSNPALLHSDFSRLTTTSPRLVPSVFSAPGTAAPTYPVRLDEASYTYRSR